jgi:hypothetical protein
MADTVSADVVALWRLQSAYADVVTRRAWPELADLFRPDTAVHVDTVTAEPRTLVGPEAFGQFVAGAIERYDLFLFVILNTVVDLDPEDPDAASGRFFMTEIRHDAAADAWHNAYGVYEDRYVRSEGHWWIAERHYRSLARTGPNAVVLGIPPWLGPEGR